MRPFTYLFLITFVATIFTSSCSKEGTEFCPAFDATFYNNWFPKYDSIGSKFTFVNDTGGRISMTSTWVNYGGAYTSQYAFRAFEKKHTTCKVTGLIHHEYSFPADTIKYRDHINQRMRMELRNTGSLNGSFSTGNDVFTLDFIGSRFYIRTKNNDMSGLDFDKYATYETHTSYTFHGTTYKNVFIAIVTGEELLKDTCADKVYFAKGYGVIGFRIHPDLEEFWLE